MGLMYTISADGEAIMAAGDMLEVLAPSDAAVDPRNRRFCLNHPARWVGRSG